MFVQFLKRDDNFGKYGKISKVVVNRSNLHNVATAPPNNNMTPAQAAAAAAAAKQTRSPTVSSYITYTKYEDAKKCIQAIDSTWLDGKLVRCSFGTTKYCAYFLRGIPCSNPDCMYLHEFANEADTFSKDEIMLKNGLPLPLEPEKQRQLYGNPDPAISKHGWVALPDDIEDVNSVYDNVKGDSSNYSTYSRSSSPDSEDPRSLLPSSVEIRDDDSEGNWGIPTPLSSLPSFTSNAHASKKIAKAKTPKAKPVASNANLKANKQTASIASAAATSSSVVTTTTILASTSIKETVKDVKDVNNDDSNEVTEETVDDDVSSQYSSDKPEDEPQPQPLIPEKEKEIEKETKIPEMEVTVVTPREQISNPTPNTPDPTSTLFNNFFNNSKTEEPQQQKQTSIFSSFFNSKENSKEKPQNQQNSTSTAGTFSLFQNQFNIFGVIQQQAQQQPQNQAAQPNTSQIFNNYNNNTATNPFGYPFSQFQQQNPQNQQPQNPISSVLAAQQQQLQQKMLQQNFAGFGFGLGFMGAAAAFQAQQAQNPFYFDHQRTKSRFGFGNNNNNTSNTTTNNITTNNGNISNNGNIFIDNNNNNNSNQFSIWGQQQQQMVQQQLVQQQQQMDFLKSVFPNAQINFKMTQ